MPAASPAPDAIEADQPALESVARPLLRVVQHITGMETSFVTAIDWEAQQQEVIFSLNSGDLEVPEGSITEWSNSMCRSMFLSGLAASHQVGGDVPATRGAVQLGMKSFVVVPILVHERPIGTVCGASQDEIRLTAPQVEALDSIGDALRQLLQAEQDRALALKRAEMAEAAAREARESASQQAIDFQRMARLAHTDELTGLPNRRSFKAGLEDALARSARRGYALGVLLIDVDRFKSINDTHGHLAGDEVLGALAAALRQTVRTQDVAARLGGDEFAMVVNDANRDQLAGTAQSIRERFAESVAAIGGEVTISIGIAHSDDSSRHQLLANADLALYRSKAAGGDCATMYTSVED